MLPVEHLKSYRWGVLYEIIKSNKSKYLWLYVSFIKELYKGLNCIVLYCIGNSYFSTVTVGFTQSANLKAYENNNNKVPGLQDDTLYVFISKNYVMYKMWFSSHSHVKGDLWVEMKY